ncbi:efflux RND transporter periplasmic adaptor subunit [Kocuria massiliensis]|uniref:efflux RND transporter periplasmic adaptor subunit n=1 Tax=Kocuria massiliensis TaxID=1926282 RepID=UPI0022B99CE1|nr:hypothetical protein [Kocuria massiliensis]
MTSETASNRPEVPDGGGDYELVDASPRDSRGRGAHRSRRRPWVTALVSLASVASVLAAFGLGIAYQSRGPSSVDQMNAVVPVWASVEQRVVTEGIEAAGTVQEGTTVEIKPLRGGILTRQTIAPGQEVSAGDLLGMVNGEPVYGLDGPLPLYRDLAVDDSGDDVLALQRSLTKAGYRVAPTGTVTRSMLAAVENLYRSDRLRVPEGGISSIAHETFVSLPGGTRTVVAVADVASEIGPGEPLVTLRTAPPHVSFRLPAELRGQIAEGTAIEVHTSLGQSSGSVRSIGPFDPGQDAAGGGYDVEVSVADAHVLVPGQSVSIHGAGDRRETLAVPLTALRQESGKTFVEVEDAAGASTTGSTGDLSSEAPTRRVDVQVLRRGQGYAAVAGNLTVGQRIRVQ